MNTQQKAIQAQIKALIKKAEQPTQSNKYSLYGKIRQLQRQFYNLECNQSNKNYLGQ